jgi:hypothetical protein
MTSTENQDKATPAEVREWAAANGYTVALKGRLSQTVKDAYTAATGRAA